MDVGLSRDLDIDIRLSSRVEVSVGHRGIIATSIDTTVGYGMSSVSYSSVSNSSSGDSSYRQSTVGTSISKVSSVSKVSSISSRSNDSSVSHGHAGKSGNEGLHCD